MGITLCWIMGQLRPKTGNPLAIFVLSIFLIVCITNVSKKVYYSTEEYQLSVQHKISTGECCLVEIMSAHGAASS